MPPNPGARTRNRSSSNSYVKPEGPKNWNQYHTPLVHHVSAVHQPATMSTPPLRPASVTQNGAGMSAASRYTHNLKVLRRRDPSILRIFDQFSHVCVYHHNGEHWEKKGFEGSMFLYERADYPPYGFYILNRMGMEDYIQRLWPEDSMSVTGSYLMLRTWPEWSRQRISGIESSNNGIDLDPFDERYKWDEITRPNETENCQTIGLWMFATDSREPLITVMLRLHGFIKQNLPYPEEFRYGPDKPPPPNPNPPSVNGIFHRTASAASNGSGVSTTSSSHTDSASTSSQPRSQRHSPNVAYVNPLLYQASDSVSTTAANPKPLKSVVEPPQAKAKNRKRKGKGEKVLSESGDVTPMAGSSNQVSDLNMLFAKLVQPPTSGAEASSEVRSSLASSKKRVPSFLETLMGSPEPTAIPATKTASHQPPANEPKSTKITLEGLFASALNPTSDNTAYDPQKNQYKPDSYIWDHRQQSFPDVDNSMTPATTQTRGDPLRHIVSTSENTGMALLNDIFASASATGLTSSIIAPSDPISFQNNASSASNQSTSPLLTNTSKHADEPETIEIYSPRPKAPLSLASMFDAAVRDATPSPSTELGLGLSLDGIQENVRQGNQMMLTTQVLDTLLGTGGSMDLDTQDYRLNGHVVAEADTNSYATAEVNGAEPEEIRRKLLDMIGLGTASLPHPPATNGDATPRVLLKDIQTVVSNSLPTSAEFLKQPTQPADVSFAETDYAFNEGDDDDEAIVELDFSDTRALSDLRAFENRERALREQLVERRAASRSASRSTTPAVLNHGPIPNKAKVNLRGPDVNGVDLKTEAHAFALNGENRYAPYASSPSTALPSTLPQITSSKVTLRPVTPAEIPRKISAPIADTPVTPPVPTTIAQKPPSGSPSKKKTRRGRGRGKEKERHSKEGSPVPNMQSESISHAMGSVTSEDIDGQPDVETKGMAMEELSVPSSSSHNNDFLIDSEVSSQINASLSFVLSEKDKYQVNNREELAELATRLLQTDRNFVDELWWAWKGSNEKFATISEGNISTVIASMTSPVDAFDTNAKNGDQKSESPCPTLPHIALTHSAPAKLPTFIDGSSSVLFDAVRPVSPQSDFQHTLSGLPSPAIVNNGKVIEAVRQGDPAIIEEENSPDTADFGDADEGHVVERLL